VLEVAPKSTIVFSNILHFVSNEYCYSKLCCIVIL